MSLLIVALEEEAALAVAERLRAQGQVVLGAAACRNMVREAVRLDPAAVVLQADVVDEALLEALALLQQARGVPVLLFGDRFDDGWAEAAAAAGVLHAAIGPCTASALAIALPLARAVFERSQALQRALAGANARLDERKWVDRAKGVLMSAQGLSEQDAFALLRTASMQTNLRVGEVSRALIEAAAAAEAVNRVGQLRMLSQRIVKALVQHALGIERANAATVLADSIARGQAAIDHIAGLGLSDTLQPLASATVASWRALREAIGASGGGHAPGTASRQGGDPAVPPVVPADLPEIDGRAQDLLTDAQRLTDALQAAAGRPNLQVVDTSARQRMLAQRVAKQALLAEFLPAQQAAGQAQALAETAAEFEAALSRLEHAPLHSDEIRATLAVARGQWQRLLAALRAPSLRDGREARIALARESEALLQSFEQLTALVERSMQVLMA